MEDPDIDAQTLVETSMSSSSNAEDDDLCGHALSPRPASTNLSRKTTTSLNGGATQDMRCWNKVLLQWIAECKFIECNYFKIEQSDIEGFYKQFRKQLNNGESQDTPNHRKRLRTFLEDQYPDFELNFNDENQLCSSDYIYVYSLLLHYCCVKCPDEFFHNTCKKLSHATQNCIAAFFNLLFDTQSLTRDCLRHAIAAIVDPNPSPKQSDSLTISCGGLPSPNFNGIESPIKTPKRNSSSTTLRISPSTPKTFMLEERTRELFNLRAQLETERYEKGVLEVQIKQYEDSIAKINQDHRKLVMEIQDLKSQLLAKNAEVDSENQADDDQVRRRLCKEISQKEEQITQLNVTVRTLEEDKTMLQQKLKFAQNQVIICMDRVNELDCRVEELNQILDERNVTIKSLSESKAELEQFIAEVRATSANRRADLNMSVECLDNSFARTTNSSTSVPSPENLGVSVVDIQLREIEKENHQLREEVESYRTNNNALIEHMHGVLTKYWEQYKSADSCFQFAEQLVLKQEPLDEFEIFVEFVNKLSQSYTSERECVRKFRTETELLQQTNDTLNKKLVVLEDELVQLKERANAVTSINKRLDMEKIDLQNQLQHMETEMQLLKQQTLEINTQLTEVNDDYQKYMERTKKEIQDVQNQLYDSQCEIAQVSKSNKELSEQRDTLEHELSALHNKYCETVEAYEERISMLDNMQEKAKCELANSQATEAATKVLNDELLNKLDELKSNAKATDAYLRKVTKSLEHEQLRAKEMGEEINVILSKNKQLEERISELQSKQDKDDENYRKQLSQLTKQESELRWLYEKTNSELAAKQSEYINAKGKIESLNTCMEALFNAIKEPLLSRNTNENFAVVTEKVNVLKKQAALVEQLQIAVNEKSQKIGALENELQDTLKVKEALQETQKQLENKLAEHNQLLDERAVDHADALKQHTETNKRLEKIIKDLEETHKQTIVERDRQLEALELAYKELEIDGREKLKMVNEDRDEQLEAQKLAYKKLQLDTDDQIKELQRDLQLVSAENNANFEQLQELRTKHKDALEELEQTKNTMLELQSQVNTEKAAKEEAMEQLSLTKKELEDNEYEWQQKVVEAKQQNEQLQEKDELLRRYEEELQQLTAQWKEEKALSTILEQSINELNMQLAQARTQEDELLKKVEAYSEQETTWVQLGELADVLKKEVDQIQNDKKTLSVQNAALKEDLTAKQAELNAAREEQQKQRDDFNGKVNELKARLTECTAELEKKDWEIEDMLAVLENNYDVTAVQSGVEAFTLEVSTSSGILQNLFRINDGDTNDSLTQLKHALNRLLYNFKMMEARLQHELDKQIKLELTSSKSLTALRTEHANELERKANEIKELQEQLSSELEIKESKLRNELKQLFNERENLENVNKKLSSENAYMQQKMSDYEEQLATLNTEITALKSDKDKLNEELKAHADKQKKQEQKFQERQKEQQKLADAARKQYEVDLEKLKVQLAEVEKNKNIVANKLKQLEQRQPPLQQKIKDLQVELEKLQKCNEQLETNLQSKSKDIASLEAAKSELTANLHNVQENLASQSKQLDSVVSEKLSLENKYAQLQSEQQQTMRNLEVLRVQQQTALADIERLSADIESGKRDKLEMHNELKDKERELQRANDNLTQLIQEIASIRREKEGFINENQLLSRQLNEINKIHENSESQLKEKIQNAQSLERQMLAHENELKTLRDLLAKHINKEERLTAENAKLRENSEAQTKRVEKYALQLGEAQARQSKLERDNDKLNNTLQSCNANLDALQREKEQLQMEFKHVKEKYMRVERAHEQLSQKVKGLEADNTALRDANIKLEHNELESLSKIKKLEKARILQDDKMRALNNSLTASDAACTRLNLEIGALNSQLIEMRNTIKSEHATEIESLTSQLKAAKEQAEDNLERNEKLKIEVQQLHDDKATLSDRLDKMSLALNIKQEKCSSMAQELEQLRAEHLIMREERTQALEEQRLIAEKYGAYKIMQEQRYEDKCKEVQCLTQQVNELERDLANAAQRQETLLSAESKSEQEKRLDEMSTRLKLIGEEISKEKDLTAQLRMDNQILQAKYQEAKEEAIAANASSEKRIKEVRLDMEGKLEKMKTKMKILFNEEREKQKRAAEHEHALMKSEKEMLKAQIVKYEEHNRKLSSKIVNLSDRILELQTENTICQTKLKHMSEEKENCQLAAAQHANFKRPTSMHVVSSSSQAAGATNIGTNFAMEDEEGEVFNNTYLTDLKSGRMSDLMSRDVCAEELKYRNSLLPPHLKSTYAAQYLEQNICEDELKDGPQSLDDSMLALLSTSSSSNNRKKCSGVTHYKRPGPPTPSKNGGRLSFGGSSEPAREILKESNYDGNAVTSSSSAKTPARFSFFSSRFSLGNAKDEHHQEHANTANTQDLRKLLQKRHLHGVGICTSTPRKSRTHELRRNLEHLLTSTPKPITVASLAMSQSQRRVRKSRAHLLADSNIQVTPLTALPAMVISAPIAVVPAHKLRRRPQLNAYTKHSPRRRCDNCRAHDSASNTSKLMKRYLKRLRRHVAYSPATDDTTTTNSPASSAASRAGPCSCQTPDEQNFTTPPSTGDLLIKLERQLRRRRKTKSTARVSLNVRGNMFAKPRSKRSVALKELNVAMHFRNKRKERNENFYKNRAIPLDVCDLSKTRASINTTFDFSNNNYSTINHNNKLNETMVIVKAENITLPVVKDEVTHLIGESTNELFDEEEVDECLELEAESVEESFMCKEESELEQQASTQLSTNLTNEATEADIIAGFGKMNLNEPQIKKELITTFDLQEFDKKQKERLEMANGEAVMPQIVETSEADKVHFDAGDSQHFEQLLAQTHSNAPFELNLLKFDNSGNLSAIPPPVSQVSTSTTTTLQKYQISTASSSTSNRSLSAATSRSTDEFNHEILPCSTAIHTQPSPSAHLSRTIYGGSVIINRRLPHIDTTYMRKSSIYIKNQNATGADDIILVTNQTITLLDLLRMWRQMNMTTRCIIVFSLLASLTTLLSLVTAYLRRM